MMFAGTGTLSYLATDEPQRISLFPEGSVVELTAVRGESALCRRLESMGLLSGKSVTLLKNRGRGLLLKTENTRLAIRLSPSFEIEARLCAE